MSLVKAINGAWPKISPSPEELIPSSMDQLEDFLGHPPVQFHEVRDGESFEDAFARIFGKRA